MVRKRKMAGKPMTLPAGVAVGLVISLIVTLLGAAILAYLISNGTVGQNGIGAGSGCILFLASAMGAWSTCRGVKGKYLLLCGISGGAYYLMMLSMTALFFGGQYQGVLLTGVLIFLGASVPLFLEIVRNKGRRTPGKRKAFC